MLGGCPIVGKLFLCSVFSSVPSGSVLREPFINGGSDVDNPKAIDLRGRVVTGYAGLSEDVFNDGGPSLGAVERFWGNVSAFVGTKCPKSKALISRLGSRNKNTLAPDLNAHGNSRSRAISNCRWEAGDACPGLYRARAAGEGAL
ncbi:hypothetical protein NM208_g11466 [Fusarium decemcellulare]|uniref:Uncharacterized protein n=1 Tax=Fusarium decemcellulare TaxID=57161 RepID=A0ACC1RUP4_9HYPO|nr:hypothetical protein NM208_g11466 [Fusarium decemcellulare]